MALRHNICLSINTGRCGTTFLSKLLKATYAEQFEVYHETVGDLQTKPRRYLWRWDEADFDAMGRDPDIAAFLDRLEAHIQRAPFVDPGNNLTPLVPLLATRFPGRVRVLHLVRDPVTVAASFTTFTMYAPGTEHPEEPSGWCNTTMPPNPKESRCAHPEFAERWDAMTPFEKNLWRWAEYNLFGLEFHRRFPDVPYLKIAAGELYGDPVATARRIIAFYGLPARQVMLPPSATQNTVNPNLRYRFHVGEEWRRYARYPYILALASELGVPVPADRLEERMQKYGPPSRLELFLYRSQFRLSPSYWQEKWRRWTKRLQLAP